MRRFTLQLDMIEFRVHIHTCERCTAERWCGRSCGWIAPTIGGNYYGRSWAACVDCMPDYYRARYGNSVRLVEP